MLQNHVQLQRSAPVAVHAILLMADIRRLHQLRLLIFPFFSRGFISSSIPGVGFQPSTVWVPGISSGNFCVASRELAQLGVWNSAICWVFGWSDFGKRHRVIASCVRRKAHAGCFSSLAGFAPSAFFFGPLESYVIESVNLDHGLMFEQGLVYKDYRRLATHLFSISGIDLKYWKRQMESLNMMQFSGFNFGFNLHPYQIICRKTKPAGVSESAKTVTLAQNLQTEHFSKQQLT